MATTLLNQIFYITNKFDNDLLHFEPYMLLQKNIAHISPLQIKTKVDEPNISETKTSIPVTISHIFTPNKEDTLFWCIYTLYHGESDYHMLGGRFKNKEIQEKQNILNYTLKNHSTIKTIAQNVNIKISNVRIQETESEFMINKKTSWYAFWFMCIYYKINAIIIQDNVYMNFQVNSEYKTHIFYRTIDKHISVDCEKITNKDTLDTIICNKLEINPFNEKILNGISTYKLPNLVEIGQKINVIPDISKPKKADWYNLITSALVNMHLQN